MITKLGRENRVKIFIDYLNPCEDDRILDLGSENGPYLASIIAFRKNVFIADISRELLENGRERFGFNIILLEESGGVPCPDKYFDIIFCILCYRTCRCR